MIEKLSKKEVMAELSILLRARGYRKKGAYWYKDHPQFTFCVNVLGSQWDTDDYYIEMGFAVPDSGKYPTCLHWSVRSRCFDEQLEQVNISLETIERWIRIFEQIQTEEQLERLKKEHGTPECNWTDVDFYPDTRLILSGERAIISEAEG